MRSTLRMAALGFAILVPAAAGLEAADKTTTTQALMRRKLENIHGVLDGLALADFPKMKANAAALKDLSRATEWYRAESPEFLIRAQSFQESAGYLVEQADAKNLDGVAMGYIRVVMDCMKCHSTLRDLGAAATPKKL